MTLQGNRYIPGIYSCVTSWMLHKTSLRDSYGNFRHTLGGGRCPLQGGNLHIIIVSSGGWEVSMTTQMVQKDHACCHKQSRMTNIAEGGGRAIIV